MKNVTHATDPLNGAKPIHYLYNIEAHPKPLELFFKLQRVTFAILAIRSDSPVVIGAVDGVDASPLAAFYNIEGLQPLIFTKVVTLKKRRAKA